MRQRRVRTPNKATARVPINQAGYISATSDILQYLTCVVQPVHTYVPQAEVVESSVEQEIQFDTYQ